MGLFSLAQIMGFLSRYGHIIAIATALVTGLWWAHNAGVRKERAKWEAAQAETTEALRAELREANAESRQAAQRLSASEQARQEVLDEYEKLLSEAGASDNPVCVSPDGLRNLSDTIQRLRPKRRAP